MWKNNKQTKKIKCVWAFNIKFLCYKIFLQKGWCALERIFWRLEKYGLRKKVIVMWKTNDLTLMQWKCIKINCEMWSFGFGGKLPRNMFHHIFYKACVWAFNIKFLCYKIFLQKGWCALERIFWRLEKYGLRKKVIAMWKTNDLTLMQWKCIKINCEMWSFGFGGELPRNMFQPHFL